MATTLSQIRLAEVSASKPKPQHDDPELKAVKFNYQSITQHTPRAKKSSKKLLVFIPLLFLLTLVFVVIILLDAIGSPLVTLARLATDQFNTQDMALEARTSQLLNYKINQTNSEPSQYKIINDYRKLSSNLVNSLQKEGVTIDKTSQTVKFKDKKFTSNQFISHLDSNILLAKAVNDATTTRRSVFQDNVWRSYQQATKLTQTGIDSSNKTNLSIEEQELALTKSTEPSFRFQTKTDHQTITDVQAISQNLTQLNQTADKLAKQKQTPTAKDFVNLIFIDKPQDNCSIYKTSQAIQNYQKTSQANQLSKLAALLLTEADKIRAGEADPAVVDYLNKRLTESQTYIHNGEEITQKSALDSYAIRYLSGNDSEAPDYSGQKYVIGANQPLAQAINTIESQDNSDNCNKESFFDFKNLLTNIWNFITGQQLSNEATKYFTKEVKNNTTSTNLSAMTGLATAPDLVGEDLANAFTSGVAELMSTSAQKSGLIALTKSQAVAYLTKQQELIAKRAKIDRLTLSPFNTNSPYTFLGNIAFQFAIISAKPGMTNSLLAFSKLALNSFTSLFESAEANSQKIKLSLQNCYDQEYLKANPNLALSSFCSPIYGVPVEALNLDPETVIEKLVTSGNLEIIKNSCTVDGKNCQLKTTGQLKNFENNCLKRQTKLGIKSDKNDYGQSCIADSEVSGLFASYFIDQRMNHILNGKNSSEQKGTGEIEIVKTDQMVIIYPTGKKSGKASLWLAGSGERTVENTLGQGLPKYAIDNPTKINEVIIIPIKNTGGWSINYAVKIVNQALEEIKQRGYHITQLDGYGFSAGAIGIGSLAATKQVKFGFTNIYALGGSLGSHRELANLLIERQIEKIYSFVGARDGGKNIIDQQRQYFINHGLESQIYYEIVNGIAHNSSQLIDHIKKTIIDN